MATATGVPKKKSAYRDAIILLVCVILGAVLGLLLGDKATYVKPIGQVFLNMLFVLVVPLVFFSISSSIASISDTRTVGKLLGATMGVFISTGVIACIVVFTLSNFVNMDVGLQLANDEQAATAAEFSMSDHIVGLLTQSDFPNLLSRQHLLPLIIFAVFLGLAVNKLGEKGTVVANALSSFSAVFYKMVGMWMKLAPIGLGAYFADLTGTYGPDLLKTYLGFFAIYYPLMIVYFFVAFAAYAYFAAGTWGVKNYFRHIITPALNAIGTRSSAATIPLQMEACDKLNVPRDVSSVVVPMGATCHMDGACLSIIFKIIMMFALFNMPFGSPSDYVFAVLVAVGSAVAVSSVPGGGAVSETMMISMYGFPMSALPILLMITQLGDPATTLVNSCGDTVASMMVSRIVYGKDWYKKKNVETAPISTAAAE